VRILISADPELAVPPRFYGGIERVIASLVEELGLRGHEVALIAHRDSTSLAAAFYPWSVDSSRGVFNSVRNAVLLTRAVRSFRPDVVHSFSRLASLASILPRSIPKIMSYQRSPTCRTVRQAARLAGGSLFFTGCSEYIAAEGRRCGGEWRAIHNFIDPEALAFNATVADDAPLVFLSRVERIKGAHTAIEIARRAGRRLIIAGNHSADAEAAAYWRDLIDPSLGRDGIEYAGPVDDAAKSKLLSSARAMLVPIEWDEPFGIVFAEALACGTPVISTPRGALPEIVRQGKDGFLVSSIEEGVSAVERLGEIDRAGCRARAVEHFSRGTIVSRYEALYAERAAARAGKRRGR
jgi:glycosyltransferase involved in cell wall biosynthesis